MSSDSSETDVFKKNAKPKKKLKPIISRKNKMNSEQNGKDKIAGGGGSYDFFDRSKAKEVPDFRINEVVIELDDDDERDEKEKGERMEGTDQTTALAGNGKEIADIIVLQTESSSSGSRSRVVKRKRSVTPPTLFAIEETAIVDLTREEDPVFDEFVESYKPIQVGANYLPAAESLNTKDDGNLEEIYIEIKHEYRRGELSKIENYSTTYQKWAPIADLLGAVSRIRGIPEEDMILTFKNAQIYSSSSLGSAGVSFDDNILQSYHREDFRLARALGSSLVSKALQDAFAPPVQEDAVDPVPEAESGVLDESSDNETGNDQKLSLKIIFSAANTIRIQVDMVSGWIFTESFPV